MVRVPPITFTRMFEPRHNILSNVRADIRKYIVSWLKHSRERNRLLPGPIRRSEYGNALGKVVTWITNCAEADLIAPMLQVESSKVLWEAWFCRRNGSVEAWFWERHGTMETWFCGDMVVGEEFCEDCESVGRAVFYRKSQNTID